MVTIINPVFRFQDSRLKAATKCSERMGALGADQQALF
jgi:hypothetical protein